MRHLSPTTTGVGTFVAGAAIAIAVFAFADVSMTLIIGPLIVIAIASFGAYKAALEDHPRAP